MKRAVIYTKDIQRITGKSEKYSRRLMIQIKTSCAKEPHQFISIEDFCRYTGLSPELVTTFIID